MPSLKDLHCHIELSVPGRKLQELGISYGDGVVETFVAVPSGSEQFAIRLMSNSFIAPGLAMYVFIDGVYQCNRNRQGLKLQNPSYGRPLIDFRVRQKEERQRDGSMTAHEWRFEKLNVVGGDNTLARGFSNFEENVGCIEVVVLRCAGLRGPTADENDVKQPQAMNLDGAGDTPDHASRFDGRAQQWGSKYALPHYDDRGWPHSPGVRHVPGIVASQRTGTQDRPPPPIPPRSGHAGTIPSRYSQTIWREAAGTNQGKEKNSGIPSPGYQYGSGPIPNHNLASSTVAPPPSVAGHPPPPLDQQWLDHLLTKAVKRGVEESQRMGSSSQSENPHNVPAYHSQDLPGAWPLSPFGPSSPEVQPQSPYGNAACTPAPYQGSDWVAQSFAPEPNHHVSWGQPAQPTVKAGALGDGCWSSTEENSIGSWSTEHSWGQKQHHPLASSLAGPSSKPEGWYGSGNEWAAKSRPQEPVWVSKEDKDGWAHIDAASDTEKSWTSTIRPSSSISAYGMTFEDFMRKTTVNNICPGDWKGDWKAEQSFWGDKISKDKKTHGGKTIVTVDDGWGCNTRWHDTDPKDNGWGETVGNYHGWDTEGDDKKKEAQSTAWDTPADTSDINAFVKANTSKPWLSTRRPPLSASVNSTAKAHWKFPPAPNDEPALPKPGKHNRSLPEAPPTVSKAVAKQHGISHHVATSTATKYGHAVHRPSYIDTLSSPYAVFRFKYRSPTFLARKFGPDALASAPPPPADEKEAVNALKTLPRDVLIDSLLQLQKKVGRDEERDKKKGRGGTRTEDVGRERTKDWVRRQSREASEKGRDDAG